MFCNLPSSATADLRVGLLGHLQGSPIRWEPGKRCINRIYSGSSDGEVRHFCGSRRDQEKGGGAGPSN